MRQRRLRPSRLGQSPAMAAGVAPAAKDRTVADYPRADGRLAPHQRQQVGRLPCALLLVRTRLTCHHRYLSIVRQAAGRQQFTVRYCAVLAQLPTHIPTLRTLPVKRSSQQRVAYMRPRRISERLGHLPCGFTYKVAQLPPQTVFIAAFLLLALSSADCQAGSSLPVATLDVAATLLYDSARASAAARSPGAIAGFAFTASSSITAPFTVARFARSEFLPFVSICTARAANLYVSHNF